MSDEPKERKRKVRPPPLKKQLGEERPRDLYDEEVVLSILAAYDGPATITELSRIVGVSGQTINRWLRQHTAFHDRVTELRNAANDKVEASLYDRAVGYDRDHVEEHVEEKDGTVVKKRTVRRTEFVVPDVGAQKLWLINRKPDEWSDRKVIEDNRTYHDLLTEAAAKYLDLPPEAYREIEDDEDADT